MTQEMPARKEKKQNDFDIFLSFQNLSVMASLMQLHKFLGKTNSDFIFLANKMKMKINYK